MVDKLEHIIKMSNDIRESFAFKRESSPSKELMRLGTKLGEEHYELLAAANWDNRNTRVYDEVEVQKEAIDILTIAYQICLEAGMNTEQIYSSFLAKYEVIQERAGTRYEPQKARKQ